MITVLINGTPQPGLIAQPWQLTSKYTPLEKTKRGLVAGKQQNRFTATVLLPAERLDVHMLRAADGNHRAPDLVELDFKTTESSFSGYVGTYTGLARLAGGYEVAVQILATSPSAADREAYRAALGQTPAPLAVAAEEFFSIPQAAKHTGKTERTIRAWMSNGWLVAERHGKHVRIAKKALENCLLKR
jgi:excisionase family DNA binding protein